MKSSNMLLILAIVSAAAGILPDGDLYHAISILITAMFLASAGVCQAIEKGDKEFAEFVSQLPKPKVVAPMPDVKPKYDGRNGNGYQPVKQPMTKQEFIDCLVGSGWSYDFSSDHLLKHPGGPSVVWVVSGDFVYVNSIRFGTDHANVYERILTEQLNINIPEPKPPGNK